MKILNKKYERKKKTNKTNILVKKVKAKIKCSISIEFNKTKVL